MIASAFLMLTVIHALMYVVGPFTYSIKEGNGRILEMFSERVENLRGLYGGALGSIAKWDFSI